MLRDPARNTIELSVSGDRITALELILLDKDKRITPLDLEMVTDFLLEAAGLSSGKIHKFNEQMQSVIQSIVASTDKEPIRLNASRYLLTLRRPDPGEPLSFYRITVNSMDASREVLAEHSAPTLDTSTGSSSEDRKLKGEFQSLVESWHKIKHAVVRQLKKEDLSSVLAGKALARQTDAINWLVKNGKHYEMKSQGIELERFEALEPGKRYSVYVEVRESSKLIDDKSRQVLKQSDDSYQVNYTVEKIKGHWYITDSMIVEEAGAKAKRGSNS